MTERIVFASGRWYRPRKRKQISVTAIMPMHVDLRVGTDVVYGRRQFILVVGGKEVGRYYSARWHRDTKPRHYRDPTHHDRPDIDGHEHFWFECLILEDEVPEHPTLGDAICH